MLSIVLLAKQSWIKKDCWLRLIFNLNRLRKLTPHTDIVVVDNTANILRWLIWLIAKCYRANYLHIKTDQLYYSPSKIKNRVAEYVFEKQKKSYIFYLDIDVLINEESLDYLFELMSNQIQFFVFPVCFTCKTESTFSMFRYCCSNRAIQFSSDKILQVGYVTGIQLIHRDLYFQLSGYNEQLIGYGGEDIEFMHRATLVTGLRKKIASESTYYTDDRGYDLDKLIGFRNFYYKLYKSNFRNDIFSYHFYHKRKNKSNYLKNRIHNDKIMLVLMKEFDTNKA